MFTLYFIIIHFCCHTMMLNLLHHKTGWGGGQLSSLLNIRPFLFAKMSYSYHATMSGEYWGGGWGGGEDGF